MQKWGTRWTSRLGPDWLATAGALTGPVLGPAQALALPRSARRH